MLFTKDIQSNAARILCQVYLCPESSSWLQSFPLSFPFLSPTDPTSLRSCTATRRQRQRGSVKREVRGCPSRPSQQIGTAEEHDIKREWTGAHAYTYLTQRTIKTRENLTCNTRLLASTGWHLTLANLPPLCYHNNIPLIQGPFYNSQLLVGTLEIRLPPERRETIEKA